MRLTERLRRRPRPRPPLQVQLQLGALPEVRHVIERKPQPRPVRLWLTFSDGQGRRWVGPPAEILGRSVMLAPFPLQWVSGRLDDYQQVAVEVHLEY